MHTIGLDVHQRSSVLCVLDRYGKQIASRCLRGGLNALHEELAQLNGPFQICYEASCGYGPLHDHL